ncbi:MAG: TetR/AcrR family transcriptional regulator [Paracoccaceae bacterium]
MARDTQEAAPKGRRTGWKQNPEAVRENILRVAREVFSEAGFSGARVDEIAARTETSKRMLYYYFGDKEGLYRHALEASYREVREGEHELDLVGLSPDDALRKLVEFTFDHHRRNPEFIRLVMIENIHNGASLAQSKVIKDMNKTAIAGLEDILARGRESGVFRSDIKALALHWQISALCFYNVSNRITFSALFSAAEMFEEEGQIERRDWVVDAVLRKVLA